MSGSVIIYDWKRNIRIFDKTGGGLVPRKIEFNTTLNINKNIWSLRKQSKVCKQVLLPFLQSLNILDLMNCLNVELSMAKVWDSV